MLAYVEATASWLLKNQSGRDQRAFTKGPSFAGLDATISVTSPDCGASGATLGPEYMAGAPEGPRIPALKRESVSSSAEIEIQEWLVISENPDAPLPTPICRGIYMGIEPTRRSLENKDFALSDDAKPMLLKGGFYYGVNRRDVVYIPPRPLLNNGIHRCMSDAGVSRISSLRPLS
ncbi:hypothetical protein PWT90_08964 [Aphanocladium album]|nr:hypothetical protein PWT90_08964 [Aphanocladium album]